MFVLIRLGPQKGTHFADWALLDGTAVKRSPLKYPLCAFGFYGLDVNSISWLLAESPSTLISLHEGTNSSSAERKGRRGLCFTFKRFFHRSVAAGVVVEATEPVVV